MGRRIAALLAAIIVLLTGWVGGAPAAAAEPVVTVEYYGPTPDVERSIDVWRDPARGGGQPWIAVLHGGSWVAGSKASANPAAQVWFDAGFTVFNIEYPKVSDYSWRAGVPWPEQFSMVMKALDHIGMNAARLGVDPGRGAIYGFSAGGHLAMSAGLEAGNQGVWPVRINAIVSADGVLQPHRVVDVAFSDPSVGWAGDFPTSVNRTLAGWATTAMRCPWRVSWTDCAARWNDFLPENRLLSTSPDMLIFQGTADPAVPPKTAEAFQYWAARAGASATRVMVPLGHDEAVWRDGGPRQQQGIVFVRDRTR